ncbi:MAG TPA: hypothetical protein ENI66_00160 [Candidatus Yonathbacteria bacterium]|nr:hypothetical protein [Candidatus Yonathbacteria bacterium]
MNNAHETHRDSTATNIKDLRPGQVLNLQQAQQNQREAEARETEKCVWQQKAWDAKSDELICSAVRTNPEMPKGSGTTMKELRKFCGRKEISVPGNKTFRSTYVNKIVAYVQHADSVRRRELIQDRELSFWTVFSHEPGTYTGSSYTNGVKSTLCVRIDRQKKLWVMSATGVYVKMAQCARAGKFATLYIPVDHLKRTKKFYARNSVTDMEQRTLSLLLVTFIRALAITDKENNTAHETTT